MLIAVLLQQYYLQAQTVSWLREPQYSSVEILSPSIIEIRKGDKYGLLTIDGSQIVPCDYDEITKFAEGKCLLIKGKSIKGIVDRDGSVIYIKGDFSPNMNYPYFSEGLLAVKDNRGAWGYIDYDGNIAIKCNYLSALPFSCGMASVRWTDGYFVHIDKRGQICYLGRGFNDADIDFASSFTESDKGPFALVYIKGAFYKRYLDGSKDESFVIKGNISSLSHNMTLGRSTLLFDDAWRVSSISAGSRTTEFNTESSMDSEYKGNCMVFATKGDDGRFQLTYSGRKFASATCENVKPLEGNIFAVSCNGQLGIAKVNPEGNVRIDLNNTRFVLNHISDIKITGTVRTPSTIDNSNESGRLMGKFDGGEFHSIEMNGNDFAILYCPTNLTSNASTKLSLFYRSGIWDYPISTFPIDVSYEQALSIYLPASVSLDPSNSFATVSITAVNRSGQPSGPIDVYADGKWIGHITSIKANGSERIHYSHAIDIKDEDKVSRSIRFELKEERCPALTIKKNVTFERKFKN